MLRTVMYAVYFGIVLLISQLCMILPYYILRWLGLRGLSRAFMRKAGPIMAKAVIFGLGSRVSVEGLENVPHDEQRICIVANHQSLFDIPLVVASLPIVPGFIAKAELKKVPFLNFWLFAMGSILLDRKSPRSAIKAINEGVERIKQGQPICIFPEGTRSRTGRLNSFKPGSLKLALRSGSVIVPLTIRNSCNLFEKPGKIQAARVFLTVHPVVPTADLDTDSQKKLAERLQKTIGGPLTAEDAR